MVNPVVAVINIEWSNHLHLDHTLNTHRSQNNNYFLHFYH